MKCFCLILSTISILLLTAGKSKAQQAKAYETIKYTARSNNIFFRLDYADGYIGASKIKLQQAHQKAQVFTPETGTPETNGDFIMCPLSASDKREIVLQKTDEESVAPKVIHAIYKANGKNVRLIFTMAK